MNKIFWDGCRDWYGDGEKYRYRETYRDGDKEGDVEKDVDS